MDPRRFDSLVQSLSTGATRRHALAALLAGLVAPLLPGHDAAAKRKTKHRNTGRGSNRDRDKDHGKGKRKAQAKNKDNKNTKKNRAQAAAVPAKCFNGSPCIPGPGKNLAKCNFGGSSALKNKNVKGANLGGANLAGADASGANFSGANLGDACLVGAILTGARINGSTNLGGAIFCRTTMPDGSENNSGCDKGTPCCPTCDEDNPCDDGEVCCNGRRRDGDCCVTGDCNDNPDPLCRSATCQSNQCAYPPVSNGTTCNDGNPCTQSDTCQGGSCVEGNPIVCTPSDQCHNAGTCNPANGQCSNPSKPNGTSCETGNFCTIDTCQGGVCTATGTATCNTPGPCQSAPGTCDPDSGTCSYASTCNQSLQQICCPPGSPNLAGQCGNANGIGCFNGSTCCSGQCAGPATPTSAFSCGPPAP
jgi:hypothetical protein